MSYEYILHERAQEEYEYSLQWYKERSEQAALNFVIAIDDTLQLICNYPFRWRNEYRNYHELGLKKYPFSIIYTINASQRLVIIQSIYHHSRNPKKKFKT